MERKNETYRISSIALHSQLLSVSLINIPAAIISIAH